MNSQEKENYMKQGFFKKVWQSMTKFEKYPEMAACGVPKALLYLTEMMLIFAIILSIAVSYFMNQNYKETSGDGENPYIASMEEILGTELNAEEKQEITDIITQYGENSINIMFFIALGISIFISYFIITLIDVVMLSLFGLLTCWFTKIKISYKAVFNMSIYALTISIILRLIYEVALLLLNFKIKYFDIMYTAIAYICLAAAIFMIKSDVIKQQIELIKIMEEKRKENKEIPEEKKEEKEEKKEENKEDNKENKENKENKDENSDIGSPGEQGSNA